MRMKGDELHLAYLEAHNKQIPKKNTTDIEKQLLDLASLVKEQGELLAKQHDDLLLLPTKLIKRLLVEPNTLSTTPIVQQEAKTEIPEKKRNENSDMAGVDQRLRKC